MIGHRLSSLFDSNVAASLHLVMNAIFDHFGFQDLTMRGAGYDIGI